MVAQELSSTTSATMANRTPVALPVLPSDGPCELRNLTWKVSLL